MNAFDTVWRAGLWYKMLLSNINGKMYDVIFNMHCNIKSFIVFNKCKSDYFACDNGVRQGENYFRFYFRKPDWVSLRTEKDSENSVNLSFSIAVKSLPRQLTIVIGR
jgi:hypothetical protein